MGSRMDKYNNNSDIPMRSVKNKELYKQIYNAYDDFENLVVPSNMKEIDVSSLKMEITSRDEYRKVKDFSDITNNKIVRKEKVKEEQKRENEIYDINELLNKAVKDKKRLEVSNTMITSDSYLKKLRLDDTRTNLDIVKEMYEDIRKEVADESEELLKTANLSLDILSDLRGEHDDTMIQAPIKEEFVQEDNKQFYSSEFKFSKRDFDDKKIEDNVLLEFDEDKLKTKKNNKIDKLEQDEIVNDEEDFYDDEMSDSNGKFFFKILLLIFGLILVVVVAIYLLNYFNRI